MSRVYRYTVAEELILLFADLSKKEREQLLRVFALLGEDPFLPGNFTQSGASERVVQVRRLGKWLVTYWPDPGAEELYIIDVSPIGV